MKNELMPEDKMVERIQAIELKKQNEIENHIEEIEDQMDEIQEDNGRVCASDWIYRYYPNWKSGQRKDRIHDRAADKKYAKAFTRFVNENNLLEKEGLEHTTIGRGGSFIATYPPVFLEKYYPIFLAQYTDNAIIYKGL